MNKAFLSKTSMPIVGATCGRPNSAITSKQKKKTSDTECLRTTSFKLLILVRNVRHKSKMTSSLDCSCEFSLVLCASTCYTTGKDL